MFVFLWRSALALLVAWIGTDHAHDTLATDDFAIATHFLDRGGNFHGLVLVLVLLGAEKIRARIKSHGVISTPFQLHRAPSRGHVMLHLPICPFASG
jgi:hypothetical protein